MNLNKIMQLRPEISQADLARLIGCNKSFISRMKAGKDAIPLKVAIKLGEIYGVRAEEIHADVALVKQHLDGRDS